MWRTGKADIYKLTGSIKLGMEWSLSGPYATSLKGHRSALEMAVEDVNKSGLLDDAKFEIVQQDSVNTVATAINAFQKLVTTDKVLATFGPGASDQALSAVPIAQKAGVLNFGSTLLTVTDIGDYVFSTVGSVPDMIPAALDKVVSARNIKTVAILTQKDNTLCMLASKVRREKFEKLGVRILVDLESLSTDTDFTSVVAKFIKANPDMVIVDSVAPSDSLFLKQLKSAGFKGTIMTGTTSGVPSLTLANPQVYEGVLGLVGWLPDLPGASAKSVEFTKRFKERYGITADQYAAGVYDNVWVLANAIKKADTVSDTKAIKDALMTVEYEGVQGKLKFNDKRTQDHVPVVYEVKNGIQTPFVQ